MNEANRSASDAVSSRRRSSPSYYALFTICAFAAWILFTASFSKQELALGAGCAIAAGWFSISMAGRLGWLIAPSLRDSAEGWRLPWYLLTDTLLVIHLLIKDLTGKRPPSVFLAVPFEKGDGKRGPIRSALAVAYTSATPNAIVLGIDREQHRMLLHQLSKSNIPAMTRHLGAEGENDSP